MIVATMLVAAVGALVFMILRMTEATEGSPVTHRPDPARDHALWVARDRLTAGEIDAEQYERIVHALSR